MQEHDADVRASQIEALASSYAKVIMYHDAEDYDELQRASTSLLNALKVPNEKAEQASRIVSSMYRASDEADKQLNLGFKERHDEIFAKIFEMAGELDLLLEIRDGSVRDEVKWWYHYRLSRSRIRDKKPNTIKAGYHFLIALSAIYLEHLRRVRSPIKSLQCMYWLAKAGRRHEKEAWDAVENVLRRYWSAKVSANKGVVEPKLILV